MIREIRLWPDPVLRRRALPVEAVDSSIRALVTDMFTRLSVHWAERMTAVTSCSGVW